MARDLSGDRAADPRVLLLALLRASAVAPTRAERAPQRTSTFPTSSTTVECSSPCATRATSAACAPIPTPARSSGPARLTSLPRLCTRKPSAAPPLPSSSLLDSTATATSRGRARSALQAAGLVDPSVPKSAFVLLVELGDRVLDLAFRDRRRADPEDVRHEDLMYGVPRGRPSSPSGARSTSRRSCSR